MICQQLAAQEDINLDHTIISKLVSMFTMKNLVDFEPLCRNNFLLPAVWPQFSVGRHRRPKVAWRDTAAGTVQPTMTVSGLDTWNRWTGGLVVAAGVQGQSSCFACCGRVRSELMPRRRLWQLWEVMIHFLYKVGVDTHSFRWFLFLITVLWLAVVILWNKCLAYCGSESTWQITLSANNLPRRCVYLSTHQESLHLFAKLGDSVKQDDYALFQPSVPGAALSLCA